MAGAARLGGHGADDRGVRAPASAPAGGVRVLRSRDLQTLRARLAGHSKVDSLFDSDSYTGMPHPLSKLIVPEPLAVAWTCSPAGSR